MKTSLLFVAVLAATANAGGQPGSIGLGAEYQLSGIGGVSLTYDGGAFHAGGAIGFADPAGTDNTQFQLEGRFYYHVHHTAFADFGLGGSLGFNTVGNGPNMDRTTEVFLQPGFEIRAFLSSNVALSAAGGIVIGLADADGVALTGQSFGAAGGIGLHYYFF
ncbi:MAG TPA: hypothetical protein VGC41_05480 [Kofleriaceae bacterium]